VEQSERREPPSSLTTSGPLEVIAEVATRLASSERLGALMPGILETVRAALGASECSLWLASPSGLARVAHAGSAETAVAQVVGALEQCPSGRCADGLAVAQLAAGTRRVGALSARVVGAPAREQSVLFSTVADLLAPAIAAAEHSRQLEVEVETRTRQIEAQRRFIEKIVDSLPHGLYVIDREYRIQAWNHKRETGMQGVSREEALGRTVFEILHRQPAGVLRQEFDEVFESGRIQQFHMESTATGEVRTYRLTKIPMRLDDREVTHVITIGEDMTEWKEAQERIAQAEKLAAIGTLAAGIMHEINNPLATIAACAESMALRLDDAHGDEEPAGEAAPNFPDFMEYLRLIDGEVHRCKRIIDGLLEFSRPKPVTKQSVNVNEVVERTLFLLEHHPRFKRLAVQPQLDPELGASVRGNAEQLVQVFMALLINAADAVNDRGTVSVRTRRGRTRAEGVIAEVVDSGHGISRADQSKLFEPFFTTKPPGRGTGLGLSICYGIVSEHGGRIEVDSVPGLGSTFRIVLPAEEPS